MALLTADNLLGFDVGELDRILQRASPETVAATLIELRDASKRRSERSLYDFIQCGWHAMDPDQFVGNWHIEEICEHLEAVINGELSYLLLNLPPRHMKSLGTSVALAPWTWIKHPHVRFLYSSYGDRLSIRDSLKARRLIQSAWYQSNWGSSYALTSDQNAKVRFDNDKGGYRLATSVEGLGTGEGGDVIVVDDPHNVLEGESDVKREQVLLWWDEVMSTRLNPGEAAPGRPRAFIIVQQRVHERDLAGHVLEKDPGRYAHICLPARFEPDHPNRYPGDRRTIAGEPLWPALFGDKRLRELEDRLGPYAAAGQLQQRPTPRSGGFFDRDWFGEHCFVDPINVPAGRTVRYWDFAATAKKAGTDPDWTIGTKGRFVDGVLYIIDQQATRAAPAGVETLVKETAHADSRAVEVGIEEEPGSSGKIVSDNYQRRVLPGFTVWPDRPTGDKAERAKPWASLARSGLVKLVRGPWNKAFIDEACAFPRGAHRDRVDSVSGLYKLLVGGPTLTAAKLKGF